MSRISASACGVVISLATCNPVHSDSTALPDFDGRDSTYSNFRTRIISAMEEGPNFYLTYTLISIGCGTDCTFHLVANNETGELHAFPFGGEQHMGITLEYGLNSNIVRASFLNNTDASGNIPRYSPYNPLECHFVELAWENADFREVRTVKSRSFNRQCPAPEEYFEQLNESVPSFDSECTPNLIDFNICEYAVEVAQEIDGILPIQHSSDLQWRGVFPEGNTIRAHLQWQVSDATMQQMLNQGGMSLSDLQSRMAETTNALACSNEVLRAFVNLGGKPPVTAVCFD